MKININVKMIEYDYKTLRTKRKLDDPKFWLQIAQLKYQETKIVESGMDYLRNGLIELPLSHDLLYNYAAANIMIGKNEIALKFF